MFIFFEEYNTLWTNIYFMYVFTEQKGNKIGIHNTKNMNFMVKYRYIDACVYMPLVNDYMQRKKTPIKWQQCVECDVWWKHVMFV